MSWRKKDDSQTTMIALLKSRAQHLDSILKSQKTNVVQYLLDDTEALLAVSYLMSQSYSLLEGLNKEGYLESLHPDLPNFLVQNRAIRNALEHGNSIIECLFGKPV